MSRRPQSVEVAKAVGAVAAVRRAGFREGIEFAAVRRRMLILSGGDDLELASLCHALYAAAGDKRMGPR